MLNDLQNCYRVLELEPGATQEDVRQAYRELVKVWHPDRFAHDPKLQKKAQEKLKQINLAYETTKAADGNSSTESARSEAAPPSPPPPSAPPSQKSPIRRIGSIIVAVLIFSVLKACHSVSERSHEPRPSPISSQSGADYQSPPPQPSNAQTEVKVREQLTLNQIKRFHQQVREEMPSSLMAMMTIQEFSHYMHTNIEESDFSVGFLAPLTGEDIRIQNQSQGFFTVGSTKDAVLAVQGSPDKFTDDNFTYGLSEVRFEDGRVVTWVRYASSPLKAVLLPSVVVEPSSFFTVGSTKNEVLSVQGTPDKFTTDTFSYGLASVRFHNGKVISWEPYASGPLKAKLSAKTVE